MKPHRLLAIVLAVVAMASAACSGGSDTTATDQTTASSTSSTTTTETTTTTTDDEPATSEGETTTTSTESTTTTEATTTTQAENEYVLALSSDGLLAVEQANGSSNSLPFGSSQTVVINAVSDLLGPASESNPGTGECGNGQDFVAIWDDSIMLEFSQSTFIGWSLRTGSALSDVAGIGLGTTLAELQGAWSISIEESTLGTEFATTPDGTGYGGILSDDTDSAVVASLWSGQVCLFR